MPQNVQQNNLLMFPDSLGSDIWVLSGFLPIHAPLWTEALLMVRSKLEMSWDKCLELLQDRSWHSGS